MPRLTEGRRLLRSQGRLGDLRAKRQAVKVNSRLGIEILSKLGDQHLEEK